MTTYTISEDQNTLTSSDGEVLEAKVHHTCTGCRFDEGGDCPVVRGARHNGSYCFSITRKSKQSIIWVKKEQNKPKSFDEWMQEATTISIPEKYFQVAAMAFKAGQDSMKEGK